MPAALFLCLLLFAIGGAQAAISGVQVAGATNVQAVISYQAPNDAGCTIEVSEDPSLRPPVNDVNPDLFPGSNLDTRDAALVNGASRWFVVGRRAVDLAADGKWYSRALQTDTAHYFAIHCGADTVTGDFRTANLPVGATYPWPIPQDPQTGNFRWPSVDTDDRSQAVIDPNYGTRIRRITVPGDYVSLAWSKQRFSQAAGANWRNAAASLADDASAAIYTAGGNDWLAITNPNISFGGSYEIGSGIDFVTVRLKASSQGASPAQRSVDVCLTIDGAACLGNTRSVALNTAETVHVLGASERIDVWGAALWPQDINGNQSFGVLIRAGAGTSDVSIQYVEMDLAMSEVPGTTVAGNFSTCAPVTSNGGFHCSFPGAGGSANNMYWIHPGTGEVRWLGKIIGNLNGNQVPCYSLNALWDVADPNVYYCGASAGAGTLLLKGIYTGNDSAAPPSSFAQFSWQNLTPLGSIESQIQSLNPGFNPKTYSCLLYSIVNHFAIFNCLQGDQGSMGWLAALDLGNKQPMGQGGTGRMVAAANSFGNPNTRWCGIHSLEPISSINWIGWTPAIGPQPYTVTLQSALPASAGVFTIQISGEPAPRLMDAAAGDVFQLTGSAGFDFLRILQKNSSTQWIVERRTTGASPAAQPAGARLQPVCNAYYAGPDNAPTVYWSFLDDPFGNDAGNKAWVIERVLTGSHIVQRGNYRLQPGLDGYQIVTPGAPKSWNQPVSFTVQSNPEWAGVRAYAGIDPSTGLEAYAQHPSYENYQAAGEGRSNWFVDMLPFVGFYKLTESITRVPPFSQVYRANLTRLDRSVFPTLALCGGRMLKDITPGPIRDQDSYTLCAGAGCAAGAAASDVFLNCPPPVSPRSFCIQSYAGDPSQVCVADQVPYAQSITQFYFDRSALRNRVLTNGLMAFHSPRTFMELDSASSLPDGSWIIFPSYANNARRDLYMVKVPGQPPFDGPADQMTHPLPVPVTFTPPPGRNVADAFVSYGPSTKLGNSSAPQACSGGSTCTITIRARPGELAFIQVVYRDGNGNPVGQTGIQVAIPAPGAAAPRPAISSSGIVNAASFQPNIAPRGIVSVFGSNLASCRAQAAGLPLPSTLCDAGITFNNQPGLLYFASPGQLNVLLPGSIRPQQDVQAVVSRLGSQSNPVIVPGAFVGESAPAIFPYTLQDQKLRAVIQNSDLSLNGLAGQPLNTRPLRPGEAATLYANSLGPTAPDVGDGQAAPANPPAQTVKNVAVYINGIKQTVSFSGLTPYLSALYQVNFVLDPATPVQPGDQNQVWLNVDGAESPHLIVSLAPP
jgi:uncharacterized protein (TIGR03437 family)